MNIGLILQSISLYALPVLFAVTLHEAAHAYTARYFGDHTAEKLGRISLNPVKHIDPIGTIALPLLLYFLTQGQFLFGYAKPVPVNFSQLRNPKKDMIWVALAGPISNWLQALIWALISLLLNAIGWQEEFFLDMAKAGILVNLVMFALNLFPLLPLDGGRIVQGLLPMHLAIKFGRLEPWGFFIVLALVATGLIGKLWLYPLMAIGNYLLGLLLSPFLALFF